MIFPKCSIMTAKSLNLISAGAAPRLFGAARNLFKEPAAISARLKHTLVLIRHGESVYNDQKRFTGWDDVPLSPKGSVVTFTEANLRWDEFSRFTLFALGHREAEAGAKALAKLNFKFDVCYTSLLSRAQTTLWYILLETGQLSVPVKTSFRLNERHYGALTGQKKADAAKEYGEETVLQWRRAYSVCPPLIEESDPKWSGNDSRYRQLVPPEEFPKGESLEMAGRRLLPLWVGEISEDLKHGKTVLVSAHNNILRALIVLLEGASPEDIFQIKLPTAVPLVYRLDGALCPLNQKDEVTGLRASFLWPSDTKDVNQLNEPRHQLMSADFNHKEVAFVPSRTWAPWQPRSATRKSVSSRDLSTQLGIGASFPNRVS